MDATSRKPQVKDYPLWQLEKIAEEALKDADSCINGYRVDIEKLIEVKYGIIIDTHYNLQANYNVMAYMLTQGKRLFVDNDLLDNPRFEQRYRFTLAEELAHHIIHKNLYADCKTIDDRVQLESLLTRQESYFLEHNAKALASAILMPKAATEKRINNLFSSVGNGSKHTASIIGILSRDFDVSLPAVRRRLINLGYHKRSDLKLKD